MRRVVLILAALAVVGLAADTALAGYGYRGPNYGYRGGGYGHYSYGYRGHYGSHFRFYGSQSFPAAVRRVQAKYSTYRHSPHPTSYYKSGPHRYDYRGW